VKAVGIILAATRLPRSRGNVGGGHLDLHRRSGASINGSGRSEGKGLMELLNVRNDDGVKGILLSGSTATETHELLCEFINPGKEYQWMLAKG